MTGITSYTCMVINYNIGKENCNDLIFNLCYTSVDLFKIDQIVCICVCKCMKFLLMCQVFCNSAAMSPSRLHDMMYNVFMTAGKRVVFLSFG